MFSPKLSRRSTYPESAANEALRLRAENLLREEVEAGNQLLKKMQDEKKPKVEIERTVKELQTKVNAKQEALIQLVREQATQAQMSIAAAVNQVGKDRGLDVIVDGAGVFSGGDRLVNNGEDLTEAIVKKLSPNRAITPAQPSPTPAGR